MAVCKHTWLALAWGLGTVELAGWSLGQSEQLAAPEAENSEERESFPSARIRPLKVGLASHLESVSPEATGIKSCNGREGRSNPRIQ